MHIISKSELVLWTENYRNYSSCLSKLQLAKVGAFFETQPNFFLID